ncbi:MAG: DNA polymerase III subunit delta [Clostridiales bacterium]|nr:DNA polymerase III subunit delta [Clostridiales bacterium]
MASIGESQLKEQFKKGSFSNAYFIYGDEAYLKQYYVKRLKEKTVSAPFDAFNYHAYTGGATPVEEILKDAYIVPLMGEYVVISVCDYPFADRAEDCKKLCEFLKDAPESAIVVFWFDTVVPDVKKNARWRSLENAFSKAGSSVNLTRRSEGELVKMLVSGCKKRGAVISDENARYLIRLSGSDIKTLMNEADKLSGYAAGAESEITKDIINKVASKCLEARVFDLSKAILRRDSSGAFSILETLFVLKESPIGILSVIANCYIDMYRVKRAQIALKDISHVAATFNYKGREFVLRNAAANCRSLSVQQLRDSIDVIMAADNTLKSTALDSKTVLEETIVKLIILTKSK